MLMLTLVSAKVTFSQLLWFEKLRSWIFLEYPIWVLLAMTIPGFPIWCIPSWSISSHSLISYSLSKEKKVLFFLETFYHSGGPHTYAHHLASGSFLTVNFKYNISYQHGIMMYFQIGLGHPLVGGYLRDFSWFFGFRLGYKWVTPGIHFNI